MDSNFCTHLRQNSNHAVQHGPDLGLSHWKLLMRRILRLMELRCHAVRGRARALWLHRIEALKIGMAAVGLTLHRRMKANGSTETSVRDRV